MEKKTETKKQLVKQEISKDQLKKVTGGAKHVMAAYTKRI